MPTSENRGDIEVLKELVEELNTATRASLVLWAINLSSRCYREIRELKEFREINEFKEFRELKDDKSLISLSSLNSLISLEAV